LSNLIRVIKCHFTLSLSLQGAEALDVATISKSKATLREVGQGEPEAMGSDSEQVESRLFWKPLLLSWIALIETLICLGIASFTIIQDQRVSVASPFVFALTWLFATVCLIVRPMPTPPFDLFTLYLIHTVVGLVSLASFA
jgi:hypothetical protein